MPAQPGQYFPSALGVDVGSSTERRTRALFVSSNVGAAKTNDSAEEKTASLKRGDIMVGTRDVCTRASTGKQMTQMFRHQHSGSSKGRTYIALLSRASLVLRTIVWMKGTKRLYRTCNYVDRWSPDNGINLLDLT